MATPNLRGRISLDDSPFMATLRRTRNAGTRFASQMSGSMVGPLSRIGSVIGTAFGAQALAGGINSSIQFGAKLRNLSKSTGIAAGELYDLNTAFQENDKSTDDVASSITRMQKAIAGGAKNFKGLNIEVSDLEGLRPSQQFQAIAASIMAVKDPTDRAAAAMKIFQKSGASLIPVFEDVLKMDLSQLSKMAQHIEENAEKFDQLDDSIARARRTRDAYFSGLSGKLAGPLLGVSDKATPDEALASGERHAETISKNLPTDPAKMVDATKKEITGILSKIVGLLPSAWQPAIMRAGTDLAQGVETLFTGSSNIGPAAVSTSPVSAVSGSGWGKLETFKSFTDPLKPRAAEIKRTADFYKTFGGGDRGAMGELMAASGGSSMTKAYGQKDIRGEKWKERMEKKDKPLNKEDLESVMQEYWGEG